MRANGGDLQAAAIGFQGQQFGGGLGTCVVSARGAWVGGLGARALSNLPVVGVVGGYRAERVGLRRAAQQAYTALTGTRRE